MKNWRNSNVYAIAKLGLKPGEKLDMPYIATGAFLLTKPDGTKYKFQTRHNNWEKEALHLHKVLLNKGWDLPKIVEIRNIDNRIYTLVEWWEGETGLELRQRLGKLPNEYYYKLGQWISKLNNVTNGSYGGANLALLNYFPRNIFIRTNGDVIGLDLNKLYATTFPECFTIKYIVAETPSVDKGQVDAFLKGYQENREYDVKKIIRKYLSMFRIYHDVYIDGEFFYKGARPFKKRLDMMDLPKNMTGMYVLDLGYANGMFSLECAKRGAKKVYACDNNFKNIGPAHHRISDIGKLISVYHGFTEDTLVYKHISIDTDNFIEQHIPDTLRYIQREKKKYDIVIAFAIADHLAEERRPKFFKMLSDITDCLYYESRMGGRREQQEARLRKLTTFDTIEYLGNASDNSNLFHYAMFKCTRKGK